MPRAVPLPTALQCQLMADVGNLDHAGMSYLLGGLMASHSGEPDDSAFWVFIAKLLDLQQGKPKPPASANSAIAPKGKY